jgi:hypothetical protein
MPRRLTRDRRLPAVGRAVVGYSASSGPLPAFNTSKAGACLPLRSCQKTSGPTMARSVVEVSVDADRLDCAVTMGWLRRPQGRVHLPGASLRIVIGRRLHGDALQPARPASCEPTSGGDTLSSTAPSATRVVRMSGDRRFRAIQYGCRKAAPQLGIEATTMALVRAFRHGSLRPSLQS